MKLRRLGGGRMRQNRREDSHLWPEEIIQKPHVLGRVLVAWHRPQPRYLWALGGMWSTSRHIHEE